MPVYRRRQCPYPMPSDGTLSKKQKKHCKATSGCVVSGGACGPATQSYLLDFSELFSFLKADCKAQPSCAYDSGSGLCLPASE